MKNAEEWSMMFEQDEENQNTSTDETSTSLTVVEAGPPYTYYLRQRRKQQYQAALVTILCNLWWVILVGVACYWFPILTAQATITLVPSQKTVSVSTQLTLQQEESTALLEGHQVTLRTLPALTISQTVALPASTSVTHAGVEAHGLVTFHNWSWSLQVVGKGTTLVAQNGVEVVTDEDAVIPGAAPSSVGWATVRTHAKNVGLIGNLAPGVLHGTCCLPHISYINFWSYGGGSPATTSSVFRTMDLEQTITHTQHSLESITRSALHAQIDQGETELTPRRCSFSHTTPHQMSYRSIQITGSEVCQPLIIVRTFDVVTAMTPLLMLQVHQHFDVHAQLKGEVRVLVQDSTEVHPGVFSLVLRASGTWQYVFSSPQLETMRVMSAGQTHEEVLHRLKHTSGISTVQITVSGLQQRILPIDPTRITVVVRRGGT